MIRPRPLVAGLQPYALADLSVPDGVPLISLAQNESAWPPSPHAIAAGQAALAGAACYPDPDWADLRAAIAEVHSLSPDTILCGAGSMELIWALIHAYAGPGDEVLSTAHAYALFQTAARAAGAGYRTAPENGLTVSVDALVQAAGPRTRCVAVANPGNPTGTRIRNAEIRRLRAELPADVLLLVDEAYGEFADDQDTPVFDLAAGGTTVILRTFSKAYGLAGQRIGWGVFPEPVADEVRKLMNPNTVSAVSQAMAVAAMTDQDHMQDTVGRTATERERLRAGLRDIGLPAGASHTNFVLIPFEDTAAAMQADRALRRRGVLMRGMSGYGLPQCLRATIGAASDMDAALAALSALRGETQ